KGLDTYFHSIETAFKKVHALTAEHALVVQLISFTDVDTQLPRYLTAMEHAGFQEFELSTESETASGRVWRQVPLRRWYAMYKGNTPASKELLLIHKRAS